MSKKKIVTIIGARPQFIKAAAVSKVLNDQDWVEEFIIHTGQHFDSNMSQIFIDQFDSLMPDLNLNINGGSHGDMTGRMLMEIEKVLLDQKVDLVLVYGDTNSTLAGALAAAKLHVPVAHVEAGLRSFNMKMPEEINRILTDKISTLLFCPTQLAVDNLKKEGFDTEYPKISMVGDVMLDIAMQFMNSDIENGRIKDDYILVTIHRAENTDDEEKLKGIFSALNEINKTIKVVMPLHPRTSIKLEEAGISISFEVIEPVGYKDMTQLIRHSSLVVTDSGGLQKEAYFFHKKCVTVRDQTEWVELLESGTNILSKTNRDSILHSINLMLKKNVAFDQMLYGNGNASELIVNEIKEHI